MSGFGNGLDFVQIYRTFPWIEYKADRTYVYYNKDGDNWKPSENVDNEYNWMAIGSQQGGVLLLALNTNTSGGISSKSRTAP